MTPTAPEWVMVKRDWLTFTQSALATLSDERHPFTAQQSAVLARLSDEAAAMLSASPSPRVGGEAPLTKLDAIASIEAERKRQVEVEGWTPEHDDKHEDGQMMRAATIYLHYGTDLEAPWDVTAGAPMSWPWAPEWFKPKDRRSNLIRAGALYLAEKERLLRADIYAIGHVDHKLQLAVEKLAALSPTVSEGVREAATNLLKPFLHPADQLVDPNAGPALTVDGKALRVEVVVAAERLRQALSALKGGGQ